MKDDRSDETCMLDVVVRASKSDTQLAELYGKAEEYARLYLFAKERQKGCDGLGEMTNLKDEFRAAFDEMIGYCAEKGYLTGAVFYDADLMTDAVDKTA